VTIPPASGPAPAVAAAPPATSTGTGSAPGGPCLVPPSPTVTATPDVTLDDLFTSYGNRGRGATWTGGDGTESVALPDGRELWFFADSYLGKVSDGQRVRPGSPLVHNVLVIERRGILTRTLHKHFNGAPVAYVSPAPQAPTAYGFWPGSMVVHGATLQVIGIDVTFGAGGAFTVTGNALATFSLPRLGLLGVHPLASSPQDWSGGVMHDGGYTYLYGSSKTETYVARVVGDDLSAPWQYYDGSGWTADAASAAPIETVGTLSHFSVSRVGNTYVFITKSSWDTSEITASFGCSPVGPFGPPQPIYATPEESTYPAGDGIITYGAFAHPELGTSPKTLVVSYDVGAIGPMSGSISDTSVYRPRFLEVTVS